MRYVRPYGVVLTDFPFPAAAFEILGLTDC
jgi:hypothetical protein